MPKKSAAQKKSSKRPQESRESPVLRKCESSSAVVVDALEADDHFKGSQIPEEACSRPAAAIAPLNAGRSDAVDEEKDLQDEHAQTDGSPPAAEKDLCSSMRVPEETSTCNTIGFVEVAPIPGVHEGRAAIPTGQTLEEGIVDVGRCRLAEDTSANDVASCREIASEACNNATGMAKPLQGGTTIEPEHDWTSEVRSDIISEETHLGDVREDKDGTNSIVAATADETACGQIALGLHRVDSDIASTNAAGLMSETSGSLSSVDMILPNAVQLSAHSDCPKVDPQSKDDGSVSTLSVQASLPQTCIVRVKCSSTSLGEVVALVGSDEVLGSWDIAKAIELSTGPASFPVWSVEIPMPALGSEYKFVIKKHSGAALWEPFAQNRKWTVGGSVMCAAFGEYF